MQEAVVNILLVDDEQRNLDALEAILTGPGYRLLRADDADKALKTLLENDVAAIVLDIKMPGVSGFELAKLIKGTRRFREIPILFLTAYLLEDQDVLAGYGAGAVDYLTKPLNPQILRLKIGVFADLFRKTRALAELNSTLEARVQERTAELEASEAALRAASKQKDAFLATLAHELRNPLAPLRMGLDLLLQVPDPPQSTTRVLAAMNRQLEHMVRLIDDLLDVSRISRGMLELKKERADLGTLVERAIDTARPFVDARKQTISVNVRAPVSAVVDTTRVCQIVGNLLHNASKYAPTGGEIRLELVREGDAAVIRVADRGVGIPADQLERVFDMFARIERSVPSANTGLGIGLALSRQLAELHGGTLAASSAGEGQGATFTLRLPALSGPLAQAAPAGSGVGDTHRTPNALRIVLIEDNEDAADTLAMWLEEMGHAVQVARTGPDGLALVQEARPDVVLCDVGLPGMDGVEVCRRVKELPDVHPLMVAITGWATDADRRRTGEAGFDHHLVKPVAPDKLRDILRVATALS
ncbi:MAG: response regulator [Deltaproteobacteria bacterium]|nr:response regulator [Deltaproteobacteria bacterium]